VRSLALRGDQIEVLTDTGAFTAPTVIVCAGAWSAPLLAPFGLRAPLEAVRGYHVELPGHAALVDAPIIYMDRSILVTPMASRLRASSYMEFSGLEAAPDRESPRGYGQTSGASGTAARASTQAGSGRVPSFRTTCRGSVGRPVRRGSSTPSATSTWIDPGTGHGRSGGRPGLGREPAHDLTAFDLRRFN